MTRKKAVQRVSLCLAAALLLAGVYGLSRGDTEHPYVDLAPYFDALQGEERSYLLYQREQPKDYPGSETVAPVADSGILKEEQEQAFTVHIERAGLYYFGGTLSGGGENLLSYAVSLQLDGAYPFRESGQLLLNKNWVNTDSSEKPIQTLPMLAEERGYTSYARSDRGYFSERLAFYLTEGDHQLTLRAENQDLAYEKLFFVGLSPTPTSCGTVSADAVQAGTAQTVVAQGERPSGRSNPSILEQVDRESAATEPVCLDEQIYNTLGGSSWKHQGECVSWAFDVTESGYYQLQMRCRQDYVGGMAAYRRLYIDGEILSEDTEILTIPYQAGWQKVTLRAGEETAWFYLEAGRHTVTLEVTNGPMEQVLEIAGDTLSRLNDIYRQIVMVISTNPDPYRDYNLDTKLPEVLEAMSQQAEVLQALSGYLSYSSGGKSSETVVLDKMAKQLREFAEYPELLAEQLTTFNSNISAIGTWILDRTSQPLEIDWLALVPPNGEEPAWKAGFWEDLKQGVTRLLYSYIHDYNVMQTGNETDNEIEVWVSTGREQAQIIQRLAAESFTDTHGIGVNLKLVQGNAVMSAVIAGIGPDLTLLSGGVVNYACRNALVDLSTLEGFREASLDFAESALVPFRFNGGVYALPDSQNFPVMFYRKDILEELGLEVPQSWEDVYIMIADLQKVNMTFGLPGYEVFLYQNGGAFYANEGEYSLLNSAESVKAFQEWTSFYTDFSLPLSYNFLNRFRTGEMPIAIQDYSAYNSLIAFAPEIRDDWEMTLVPGTQDEKGELCRFVGTGVTGAYLFRQADNVDDCWKFIRWWVSGETQSRYAREVEVRMGTSARVCVASRSAFENQMWDKAQSEQIKSQWEYAVGTPDVPGGYFMSRHIDNAFRKIVYQNAPVRETLNEYVTYINKELTAKREEFGLEG